MGRARILLGLLALAVAAAAQAHPLAPSYLSLEESAGGKVQLYWKTPRLVARGARLAPLLPESCRRQGPPEVIEGPSALVERLSLQCPGGLVGASLGVAGLAGSGTDALLHLQLADGSERWTVLTAGAPRYRVPAAQSALQIGRGYLEMGITHLTGGLDHVLFVAGLLLLLQGRRRLLLAISAFTGGHSLTLALATLGLLQLPQAFTDLGIAASLVVLANEIARAGEVTPSLLLRRPWIMAFGFGLLHGLGFASALSALGLSRSDIPLALLSFNLGIELGQLGLVLLLLPLAGIAPELARRAPRWVAPLPSTLIGSLGVFWCLERASQWLRL